MSINSALECGVTAMQANSTALSAISNNIANLNTTGYKDEITNFTDVVTSNSGSNYTAGGVLANTTQLISNTGAIASTSNPLDLGIDGQGFFVGTTTTNPASTDTRVFTREGALQPDNQGFLKNSDGFYIQGWPVDANGNVQVDPSDMTKLQPVNVANVGGKAQVTTTAAVVANLSSATAPSTGVANYYNNNDGAFDGTNPINFSLNAPATAAKVTVTVKDSTGATIYTDAGGAGTGLTPIPNPWVWNGATGTAAAPGAAAPIGTYTVSYTAVDGTGAAVTPNAVTKPVTTTDTMASYNASTGNGIKPDFEIPIPVSDSQGNQRNLTLSLLKTSSNTWAAELWSPDINDGKTPSQGEIATGNIVFNSDGTLNQTATTSTLFAALQGGTNLNIGASGSANYPAWNASTGVSSQSIAMNLSGITQYSSPSATTSVNVNGTAFGNVKSIDISTTGMVSAIFDNGTTRNIAQIALATFTNPDGLKATSNNAYDVTTASGTYNLKVPGGSGVGSVVSSALEASTVDLSTEFTNLITTQRAYSAASKIITTADQMLQELISIKQ